MRPSLFRGALVLLAAAGCADRPDDAAGPVRAGDVLRPRLHFPADWVAGERTSFAAYIEVHRPGRPDPFDLRDQYVPEGAIRGAGTVRFFAGDSPLGDPVALPFTHEC